MSDVVVIVVVSGTTASYVTNMENNDFIYLNMNYKESELPGRNKG